MLTTIFSKLYFNIKTFFLILARSKLKVTVQTENENHISDINEDKNPTDLVCNESLDLSDDDDDDVVPIAIADHSYSKKITKTKNKEKEVNKVKVKKVKEVKKVSIISL